MCAAVGHDVLELVRVAIGALALGDLAPGEWRILDARRRSPRWMPIRGSIAGRPSSRRIRVLLALAAARPGRRPPRARPDAEIRAAAEAMTPALVATRRDIHQNPELGNREVRTGALVAERLRALGLEVRHPVAKTGVVGILRGGRPGPVVAVRADLDALPIQERNDVPYKSRNDGREARLRPRRAHHDRARRGRGAGEDEGPAAGHRGLPLPARGGRARRRARRAARR